VATADGWVSVAGVWLGRAHWYPMLPVRSDLLPVNVSSSGTHLVVVGLVLGARGTSTWGRSPTLPETCQAPVLVTEGASLGRCRQSLYQSLLDCFLVSPLRSGGVLHWGLLLVLWWF